MRITIGQLRNLIKKELKESFFSQYPEPQNFRDEDYDNIDDLNNDLPNDLGPFWDKKHDRKNEK
jgi:hypothetical protein